MADNDGTVRCDSCKSCEAHVGVHFTGRGSRVHTRAKVGDQYGEEGMLYCVKKRLEDAEAVAVKR